MYEIATLKSKKLPELQEIAKPLESKDLPVLKKWNSFIKSLIRSLPHRVMNRTSNPPKKQISESVAKGQEQEKQDKKTNENLRVTISN